MDAQVYRQIDGYQTNTRELLGIVEPSRGRSGYQ
jgi:hypothetical protein